MDAAKLRAWWAHRQGLDGRLKGSTPAELLSETGWARSMGGSGPYLSFHARARTSRAAADHAVADLDLHELPSARGCTYVIPAADFPLALTLSPVSHEAELKVALKLGVTEKEVDKLCAAVLKALAKGPLDPAEIREAVGAAARSLGDEGKKKGITTTVPLALGKLQSSGEIRRIPVNGRLDHQRFKYTLWKPNPLDGSKLDRDQALARIAERYFRWIAPATLANFATFAGISGKAAKAATAHLKLEPIEPGSDLLIPAADRDGFESFKTPKQAHYEVISLLDGLTLLRVDIKTLIDPTDLAHKLFSEEAYKTMPARLDYLTSHAIVDRGRIVGLWEYDPDSKSIVWTAFIQKNKDLLRAVEEAGTYIREQIDDVRSNSLDSPKSRAPRCAALRKHG